MAATPEEIRAGSDAVRSAFGFAGRVVEYSRKKVSTARQKDRVLRVIVAVFNQMAKAIEQTHETVNDDVLKSLTAEASAPPTSAHTDAMAFSQKVAAAVRTSAALMGWSIPASIASPAAIKRMEKGKLLIVPAKKKTKPASLHPKVFVKPVEPVETWPFKIEQAAKVFDNIERLLQFDVPSFTQRDVPELMDNLRRESDKAVASAEAAQRQTTVSPTTTEPASNPEAEYLGLILDNDKKTVGRIGYDLTVPFGRSDAAWPVLRAFVKAGVAGLSREAVRQAHPDAEDAAIRQTRTRLRTALLSLDVTLSDGRSRNKNQRLEQCDA